MTDDLKSCNGWTTATLYTHVTALRAADQKAVEAAFEAADVDPRLRQIESRFEKMEGMAEGRTIVWYFVFALAGMITGGVVVWGVLR